jgi:inorganic pyrophosphatase
MTMISPRPFHPWHDIPAGPEAPSRLTAVIEIPKHERNKYELDKELGVFRLDRVLHSSVHYPGDYGMIPQTLAGDDDPMDVLVLMTEPTFTGCLVEVRPVGVYHLVDKGESDEKIIAVPLSDPYTGQMHDLADVPGHAIKEIAHFFEVYKDLEGTRATNRGWGDRAAAERVITESVARYRARFPEAPPG